MPDHGDPTHRRRTNNAGEMQIERTRDMGYVSAQPFTPKGPGRPPARQGGRAKADQEKKARIQRKRTLIIAATIAAALAAAIPLTRAVVREAAIADDLRERLNMASTHLRSLGFEIGREWPEVPSAGLVFDTPRDSCSAVLAVDQGSSKAVAIRLERQKAPVLEGPAGLVWCSCDPERVSVKFVDTSLTRVAMRWLSTRASTVGGAELLSTLDVHPLVFPKNPPALGCADSAFKSWASTHREADLQPSEEPASGIAARLLSEGLDLTGVFASSRRFSVVRTEKERCYLVTAQQDGALFSVRTEDGRRPIPEGDFSAGWCTYASAKTMSLWRPAGTIGDVIVASALADRVGGLSGLREAAHRLGLSRLSVFLDEEELPADAVAALRASTVSPTTIVAPDAIGLPGKLDHTVVAFSLGTGANFLPEVNPSVPTACIPDPQPEEPLRTSTCVQARAQIWKSDAAAKKQGAAEGEMPFWMTLFGGMKDRDGLRAVVRMFSFARRMSLLGFQPTTTDGVTDTADGAVVSGRSGKGEVLAVGMTTKSPWIVPLAQGRAWTLDGPIKPITIPLGKTAHLTGKASLGTDATGRRVVVWRR